MNASKPQKSLAGQICPACREGHFKIVQIDHVEEVAEDNPLTIPGVWVDRCDHCGEIVFPGDTAHFIESVVAEHTEQLSPRELERIREDLGVQTQDEMSELLGLGTKTYHKWESGAQFPTRSMSYYIRILARFPEAFDWLRNREWRRANRVAAAVSAGEWEKIFPELFRSGASRMPPSFTTATMEQREDARWMLTARQERRNPARGLTRVVFHKK